MLFRSILGSRAIHQALGGKKEILEEERKTAAFAYACVVTIRDIRKGEIFSKDNIWVKRPGTGEIKAKEYEMLFNKRSSTDIKKDTQLQWNMIE